MKMIKIGFFAVHDGEIVSGTITKLRKRGDTWVVDETIAVMSDEPGAQREILLEDNQRLVIDATSNTKIVMDKEQNAAVRVPVDPVRASTPLSTDGEERDTPDIAESAIRGVGILDAAKQDEKDKAITAARQKLKDQQAAQAKAQQDEAAKQPEPVVEPIKVEPPVKVVEAQATTPFDAAGVPKSQPAQAPATPPAAPSWPPKGVGGN